MWIRSRRLACNLARALQTLRELLTSRFAQNLRAGRLRGTLARQRSPPSALIDGLLVCGWGVLEVLQDLKSRGQP